MRSAVVGSEGLSRPTDRLEVVKEALKIDQYAGPGLGRRDLPGVEQLVDVRA
jgi:hypothetical protein